MVLIVPSFLLKCPQLENQFYVVLALNSLPLLFGFKTSVTQPLLFIKKWLVYNYSRVTTPVSIVVEYFFSFFIQRQEGCVLR